MVRYEDEQQAAENGLRIEHEAGRHRYAVYQGAGEDERLVGEAHYSLLGDDAIDFDHTIVLPELRGTGLASLLAHRALTGDAIGDRRVHASCWFIRGYLARNPELLRR